MKGTGRSIAATFRRKHKGASRIQGKNGVDCRCSFKLAREWVGPLFRILFGAYVGLVDFEFVLPLDEFEGISLESASIQWNGGTSAAMLIPYPPLPFVLRQMEQ